VEQGEFKMDFRDMLRMLLLSEVSFEIGDEVLVTSGQYEDELVTIKSIQGSKAEVKTGDGHTVTVDLEDVESPYDGYDDEDETENPSESPLSTYNTKK
jgi:preprotein translocase subunit YajC